MTQTQVTRKIAAASNGAIVGAMGGVLFAAFASSVYLSFLGVLALIAAGMLLGWCLGQFGGAMIGAGYGGLFAALCCVIGENALGMSLTVVACMALAGWLGWMHEKQVGVATSPTVHCTARSSRLHKQAAQQNSQLDGNYGPHRLDPCDGGFGVGRFGPDVRLRHCL